MKRGAFCKPLEQMQMRSGIYGNSFQAIHEVSTENTGHELPHDVKGMTLVHQTEFVFLKLVGSVALSPRMRSIGKSCCRNA
jgi:hypothetical protein